MAVRRPRPEYLFARSRRILDPLVAVREDPVKTVAESDKVGGFQLIEEDHRPSCLFASQAYPCVRIFSSRRCSGGGCFWQRLTRA